MFPCAVVFDKTPYHIGECIPITFLSKLSSIPSVANSNIYAVLRLVYITTADQVDECGYSPGTITKGGVPGNTPLYIR